MCQPLEIHLSFAKRSLFSPKSLLFALSSRSVSSLLRYEIAQEVMPFQCHSCHAKLLKMDHLKRHQLSHGNTRAYTCQFCSLGFNRRDALLRHWRTCEERLKAGQPLPVLPRQKRGRKQNACTRCARLKKKCSRSLPCEACFNQGLCCTYRTSSPSRSTTTIDKEHPTPPSLPQMDTELAQLLGGQPLEILVPDLELFCPTSTEQEVPSLPSSRLTHLLSPTHAASSLFETKESASAFSAHGRFSDILRDCPSATEFDWQPPNINPMSLSLIPKSTPRPMNLRFLTKFTATHGLANSFECGSILARRKIMSTLGQNGKALSTVNILAESPAARLWPGSDRVPGWHHPLLDTRLYHDWSSPDFPCQSGHLDNAGLIESHQRVYSHPLKSKSHEIIQGIRGVVCHNMRCQGRTINWSPSTERSCIRFFSPLNLDRFMEAFWYFWYPNWPVFHKATFIAAQKPAQLIAALSLIGACLSPEKTDRDQAMLWVEAVGDWIHHDADFSEDAVPQTDDEAQLLQLELRLDMVRAAYAIILIMTWEGSEKQMAVARRTRFSQVVGVARSLFFFPVTQKKVYGGPDPSNHFRRWMLFALREECIRTLIYVFLLDCAFVMFHNSAPRMVVSELQFSLAMPEACFDAPTPETWLSRLDECSEYQHADHETTLSDAIRGILKSELEPQDWRILENMSLLNLFAITSAFHNLIFHHHHGADDGSTSLPITRGLRNWMRAWAARDLVLLEDQSSHPEPSEGGVNIGFYRYTREYWCLAVILHNQSDYARSLGVDTSLGANNLPTSRGGLVNFDNSDMGQVHELIIRFQDMDIRGVLEQ